MEGRNAAEEFHLVWGRPPKKENTSTYRREKRREPSVRRNIYRFCYCQSVLMGLAIKKMGDQITSSGIMGLGPPKSINESIFVMSNAPD